MLRSVTCSRLLYALLLPVLGAAHAADLSSRYTDSNGDMVADVPTDEGKWIDPATLIFAYTPVEDPAVYAKVWDEFLQHMEKVTGKKVKFFPVQSNAAQLEAMRAGRLHIAGFNTGSVPLAVNCAGFVPFTMMADKQGNYGYQMEIITHNGSGIDDVAGLRGHTLAFTSPTSNSGFKAPSALLKSEFNLEADKDFKTAFSGKHDNSIMGVVNRDYDAAAIANSVLAQMQARGMVKPDQYKVLYTSQTFPTTGYGYVYNLKPELAAKIQEGFKTFEWEGSALQAEFKSSDGEQFIPITFKQHWEVVRKIDQAMDVSYQCDK